MRVDIVFKGHIKDFCRGKEKFEYLFKSSIGFNKPLNVERAYEILNEVGGMYGIVFMLYSSSYKMLLDEATSVRLLNHVNERIIR